MQQTEVVQTLRGQIAEQAAEISRLSARYGSNNTVRQQAESKLMDLRASLARETEVAAQSLDVSHASANARRRGMQQLVDRQRSRMSEMTGNMDQLSLLEADAQRAREKYEQVSESLMRVRLQSGVSGTSALLLDPATEPTRRASPNAALLVAMGAMLGLLCGVAAAIILEHLRRGAPALRAFLRHEGASSNVGADATDPVEPRPVSPAAS